MGRLTSDRTPQVNVRRIRRALPRFGVQELALHRTTVRARYGVLITGAEIEEADV
jgi:hypothetical protein